MTIKRAIILTSNNQNLNHLAPFLKENNVEILSMGKPLKYLKQHGIKAIDLVTLPTFPALILDCVGIDLVVVNFPDFEKIVSSPDANLQWVLDQVEIGGTTLIKTAAKQFKDIVVLTSPSDYDEFMIKFANDTIDNKQRIKYAQKAFAVVSKYDDMISKYLYINLFSEIQ